MHAGSARNTKRCRIGCDWGGGRCTGCGGDWIHVPAALLLVQSVALEVELHACRQAHHPEGGSEAADVPVTERELEGTEARRQPSGSAPSRERKRYRERDGVGRILGTGTRWTRCSLIDLSRHFGGISSCKCSVPPPPSPQAISHMNGIATGLKQPAGPHLPGRHGRHLLYFFVGARGLFVCLRTVVQEGPPHLV